MPTASKFAAALFFAALGWFVSDLYKPLLPEGTQVGLMSPINAAFGLILGWRVMGKGAGAGMRSALGYGLTTAAMTAVWALVFWAAYEMVDRSTRLYYDGPMDALQDMFSLVAEYAKGLTQPDIVIGIVVGGLFFGWLTEHISRRFS